MIRIKGTEWDRATCAVEAARREDEAFSVSLTDEERQIIRDRRVSVSMTEKKAPR